MFFEKNFFSITHLSLRDALKISTDKFQSGALVAALAAA